MTPIYLNPPTSNSFPLPADDQLKEEHDHHHHLKLFITPPQTDGSSSPTFTNTTQDHRGSYPFHDHHQSQQHEHNLVYNNFWHDESSDHQVLPTKTGNGLTVKWMSSTYKQVRDEQQKYHHVSVENGNHGIIRICSNCNTTKTPLWRGGPWGPKSLCNACGIRQRKARQAMEAATNGTVLDTTADTSSTTTKKSRTNYNFARYKKQCKLQDQDQEGLCNNDHQSTNKKVCFEEFALNLLSKNSGYRGVFTQDEEEGAILLMALSCGLV